MMREREGGGEMVELGVGWATELGQFGCTFLDFSSVCIFFGRSAMMRKMARWWDGGEREVVVVMVELVEVGKVIVVMMRKRW